VPKVNPANRGSEFPTQNINAGKLGSREVVHVTKAQRYKFFKYIPFVSSVFALIVLNDIAETNDIIKKLNLTRFLKPEEQNQFVADKNRHISTWALAMIPVVGNIIALIWDLRAKRKKI
jgi:hypothetical protein